jgi:muramoyltetrapeptide carboxypeptidase
MQTPAFLKKGDTIGIAAPARSVSPDEIAPAIHLFEEWGLKVVCASNIFQKHHQFAGSDAERLAGLQSLLDNDDVRAIICARGGYGSVRMVDMLSFEKFLQNPKWIVGYSDITVLLMHIENCHQIETLHAPMAFGF